jgi:inosine/xanthosine triphosphate pyrophosphatase family protein
MSQISHADGTIEVFPHIVTDRAKPGIIAVTDRGVRFVNEANSYYRFVEAMRAEQQQGVTRFYLIADKTALWIAAFKKAPVPTIARWATRRRQTRVSRRWQRHRFTPSAS